MENVKNEYCVYMHTNRVNGKKYVGISKDYKKRWRGGSGYRSQKKFHSAILKYGWQNFKHQILEKNLTLEEAYKKEIEYIKEYDSIYNGYNISSGGQSDVYTNTNGTKSIREQIKKNLNNNPDKKISDVCDVAANIGYKLSEEEKDTIMHYYYNHYFNHNYKKNEFEKDFLKLKENMENKMRYNARQKELEKEYFEEIKKIFSTRKKYQRSKVFKPMIEEVNKKYKPLLDIQIMGFYLKK